MSPQHDISNFTGLTRMNTAQTTQLKTGLTVKWFYVQTTLLGGE